MAYQYNNLGQKTQMTLTTPSSAQWYYPVGTEGGEQAGDSFELEVEVRNLAIASVEPQGVLVWKDEGEMVELAITIEDNDLSDPMDVVVQIWPTDAGEFTQQTMVRQLHFANLTGAEHTLYGKSGYVGSCHTSVRGPRLSDGWD